MEFKVAKEFMDFIKWIGIIPAWNGVFPFIVSILQLLIICLLGFFIIYLFCKVLKKETISIVELFDSNVTDWEKKFINKLLWKYPLWGFVQQLVIITIFFFLQRMISSQWICITIAAIIFAGLHFPNLFLALATFGMEQMLLNYFLINHNLYFIGFIHGFLGTTLLFFSPSVIYTRFSTWKNYWELYR